MIQANKCFPPSIPLDTSIYSFNPIIIDPPDFSRPWYFTAFIYFRFTVRGRDRPEDRGRRVGFEGLDNISLGNGIIIAGGFIEWDIFRFEIDQRPLTSVRNYRIFLASDSSIQENFSVDYSRRFVTYSNPHHYGSPSNGCGCNPRIPGMR